ncbi:MAG: transcription antitermination factor NusB [Gemmatimonadota bacterium]|nr:transcription antitermination factor NusB [Gemmatimonadota bacterium]
MALTHAERIDRSRARAWALQVYYRWEAGGEGWTLRDALADTVATRHMSPRRLPFVRTLLSLLDEHLLEVDRVLQGALENWRLARLSTLDRGILRLGAVELLFPGDVPPKVAIQEAIVLAEAYGGPDSPRFVNGVLDALYKRAAAK